MKQVEMAEKRIIQGTCVEMECENEYKEVIFRIRGEIDHHGARNVREEMDEVISTYHPAVVKMDLSGVDFMDSAGLGLMLGRHTRIKEYGGELVLVDPTVGILKILALAGADKLFALAFTEPTTRNVENREESEK